MKCPRCEREMESGELDLKAWGVGLAPQAQLHFGGDLLLKNQYVPMASFFRKGTTTAAFRCVSCRLVIFSYPDA